MFYQTKWIWLFISSMSIVVIQGCITPSNLETGSYLINGTTAIVGKCVDPYSILTYECNDNYTKSGSRHLYCGTNGTWIGSIKCSKKCELPHSLTLDFTCFFNDKYTKCENLTEHGTVLLPKCKPFHSTNKNQNLNAVVCDNGHWSHDLKECNTDCGMEIDTLDPILQSTNLEGRKFSPWHVGIYQLKNQVYEQICGGTIVSRKFVVSAAHCFQQTPYEEYYAVAAGKIYRAWDHKEKDKYSYIQRTVVKDVLIPETYFGLDSDLEDDISVVVVKTPFDFYPQVHAACIDINNAELKAKISQNGVGKVVGWGVTKEGDPFSLSNVLMKAEIQLINRSVCINNVPREFKKFVTATKYCVKGINNTTVCNGHSGGGILVKVSDNETVRWYLVGIVSVGILNHLRTTCQINTYTAVTNIYSHTNFIINELKINDCSLPDGNLGICKMLNDCEKVIDQIKKGIKNPTICSYSGFKPMVCCPIDVTNSTAVPLKPTVPSTYKECDFPNDAITVNRTGQTAWDKCIDLADSIFPCISLDPNVDSPKMRMDTCKYTGVKLVTDNIATNPDEFPHQAKLGYDNKDINKIDWNCGGVLISEKWVMTAARCFRNRFNGQIVKHVKLGNQNMAKHSPEFIFHVIQRVTHPDYKSNLVYNDIGLLKLNKRVKYNEKIRPACLHVGNEISDQKAIATGWEIITNDKNDILMKMILDKSIDEECKQSFPTSMQSPHGIRNDSQICYESKTEAKNFCHGDIGGPLQIYNYGVHCTYTVIGIASYRKGCEIEDSLTVYTRVSSFIPWIESVVWPNSDDTPITFDRVSNTDVY